MNTLNYSFRYLSNRRGNTLARFVSISLGLLIALLIFSYVGFNLSFDRCFSDRDRIYAVWQYSPQLGFKNEIPSPLAEAMAAEIPQIEAMTTFFADNQYADKIYYNDEAYAYSGGVQLWDNKNLFDVFDFEIISGDAKQLNAQSVMISQRLAKKIFGNEDPLGKMLVRKDISSSLEYTIIGVFANTPANTSIGDFDMIMYIDDIVITEFAGESFRIDGVTVKSFDETKITSNIAEAAGQTVTITADIIKEIDSEREGILIAQILNKDNMLCDIDYTDVSVTDDTKPYTLQLELPADLTENNAENYDIKLMLWSEFGGYRICEPVYLIDK